jgi:hypothetical protein
MAGPGKHARILSEIKLKKKVWDGVDLLEVEFKSHQCHKNRNTI